MKNQYNLVSSIIPSEKKKTKQKRMPRKKDIDEIDVKILEIISSNATITNKDLSEQIELTPGPTHVRVQKLLKKGLLKEPHYELDWKALGFLYHVMVIAAVYKKDSEKFSKSVFNVPGIRKSKVIEREGTSDPKICNYVINGIFKSKDDFVEAWSDILTKLKFPVDFQVWETNKVEFSRHGICLE
ncbi:winged helix-turn-helix transcriptional regulator [Zeaxanthinibacter sp. PT1]|uniref:Lrp/AsnC family transcriptional regulator n=1 Tax=Zeaxanthinibacter TaxID=561554 RepID=UPI0023496EAC|nr:winged helix-turn-helix transcriptional regulator [Zeaxanthinibacter sp. PT1]MDC6350707.1 winged helix-turn-helix transcriptional regulator [Zeaxanthinibacter sp. PT1]